MLFQKTIIAGLFPLLIYAQLSVQKKEKENGPLKPILTFKATVVKVLQGDLISAKLDKKDFRELNRLALQSDLISVKLDNDIISIRLADIDAPEIRQPFSRQSRNFVKELALQKQIRVVVKTIDLFKRVIGEVYMKDGRNLNKEIVKWGFAWHYKVNPTPDKTLSVLEYQAWSKKLGLWLDKNPVPPWKFRSGTEIPDPPTSSTEVNYDRIFEYGLIGDTRTSIYNWPACKNYKLPSKKFILLFTSKQEAEVLGFQTGKSCPKM